MALLAVLLFAGCGGGAGAADDAGSNDGSAGAPAQTDTLSGDLEDIISQLFENSDAEIPATFQDAATAESASGQLGLTADEFKKYVTDSSVSTAAINAQAFEVALIKTMDADAAAEVAALVAKGFDSGKWICVFPEQSLTSTSGSYVLLAVGSKEQTDGIAAAFKTLAGDNATSAVFYEGPAGGGDGGGGGGLLLG
ncbi:hypothetical protein AGMMS49983_02150 [Clostridia bacterium]|nr:hypothetical protein AGMMS49983_02150 [Clostridia bacterium]